MGRLIEKIRDSIQEDVFTDAAVMNVIMDSADSRYGIIKRSLKNGDIIRLRRGLYAFGSKQQRKGINLFQIAQMIYGPSYISMESALAHHGWIPEAVYSITSASARRSKEIKTPLGVFSYTSIPSNDFLAGVERIQSPDGVFLMASPWRALADYVYARKLDWKGLEPIAKSLRVDLVHFKTKKAEAITLVDAIGRSFRSRRVHDFLNGITKELGR